jgi:hypothetical protein
MLLALGIEQTTDGTDLAPTGDPTKTVTAGPPTVTPEELIEQSICIMYVSLSCM